MLKKTSLALAALMVSGAAMAQSPINNQLTTDITIVKNCTTASFASGGKINFADTLQGNTLPAAKSDTLNFTCGLDTMYTINASGPTARTLAATGVASTIAYKLYAGTAGSCATGVLLGTGGGISDTGLGTPADSQEICAIFDAGQQTLNFSPGAYSDTVTVSLSY